MTELEKIFKERAKKIIKNKGLCATWEEEDDPCDNCLYKTVIGKGNLCLISDVYQFSINFMKNHKNKQLEFEF